MLSRPDLHFDPAAAVAFVAFDVSFGLAFDAFAVASAAAVTAVPHRRRMGHLDVTAVRREDGGWRVDGDGPGVGWVAVGWAVDNTCTQWARIRKNIDQSTGPLAHPVAHSLAPLTRSLAPHYQLCSRAPLRSLVRSLAHFAHSLAQGTGND